MGSERPIKRVRIVSCDNPLAWFANRLGQVIEVYQVSDTGGREYFVKEDVDNHQPIVRYIRPEQCEVIR